MSVALGRGMFGALHVLREEPTYATALTETDGVAYTLVRGALEHMLVCQVRCISWR